MKNKLIFENEEYEVVMDKYTNGNNSINLYQNGEPYCGVSTNLDVVLNEDEVFLANHNMPDGIKIALENQGWISKHKLRGYENGFVIIPVVKILKRTA